ncbi:hypothetical protein FB004_11628 [Sinorhizobium medicae]|nr:hypothetical protein FB004_11628 [Sinorhizobium medicae]
MEATQLSANAATAGCVKLIGETILEVFDLGAE